MKINSISSGNHNRQNFKAKLSPDVKKHFYDLIDSTDADTYEGKKIISDIIKIESFMPHVSISVEKRNICGEDYYGYVMYNPKTSETKTVSTMEKCSDNLFRGYHVNNIKYALADEYIRENNPTETDESRIYGMLDFIHNKIFNNDNM